MQQIKFILWTLALLLQSMPSQSQQVAPPQSVNIEELKADYVKPDNIPAPEDNKQTPPKVELGKMLYFDPRDRKSVV